MELLKSVFRSSSRKSKDEAKQNKSEKKGGSAEAGEIKIKEDVYTRDVKDKKSPEQEKNISNSEYLAGDRDVFNPLGLQKQEVKLDDPTPRDRWNFPIRVLSKRLGNLTKEQQLAYLRRVEESISHQQQQLIRAQNESYPQQLESTGEQETLKETSHGNEKQDSDMVRSTKTLLESENIKIAAYGKGANQFEECVNTVMKREFGTDGSGKQIVTETTEEIVTVDGKTTIKRTSKTSEKGIDDNKMDAKIIEENLSVQDNIKKFQAMSESTEKITETPKKSKKTDNKKEVSVPKASRTEDKKKLTNDQGTPLKTAEKKKSSTSTPKATPSKTPSKTEKKESVEKVVKNTENIVKSTKEPAKGATVTQVKKVIRSSSEKVTNGQQKSPLRPKSAAGSTKSPSPEAGSTTTTTTVTKRPPSAPTKTDSKSQHVEIKRSTSSAKAESKKSENSQARVSPPGATNKEQSTPAHSKNGNHGNDKSKKESTSSSRRSSITTTGGTNSSKSSGSSSAVTVTSKTTTSSKTIKSSGSVSSTPKK